MLLNHYACPQIIVSRNSSADSGESGDSADSPEMVQTGPAPVVYFKLCWSCLKKCCFLFAHFSCVSFVFFLFIWYFLFLVRFLDSLTPPASILTDFHWFSKNIFIGLYFSLQNKIKTRILCVFVPGLSPRPLHANANMDKSFFQPCLQSKLSNYVFWCFKCNRHHNSFKKDIF